MVRHCGNIHTFLCRYQSARSGSQQAPILLQIATVRSLVRCDFLPIHLLCAFFAIYALYIKFNDAIYVSQFSGWAVFLKDNWNTATFITNYLPLIMFPIFYIGAKLWKRSPVILASEMDFQSGLAEIEADTYDEPPPRNNWEKFWQWLVCVSVFHIWADLNAACAV